MSKPCSTQYPLAAIDHHRSTSCVLSFRKGKSLAIPSDFERPCICLVHSFSRPPTHLVALFYSYHHNLECCSQLIDNSARAKAFFKKRRTINNQPKLFSFSFSPCPPSTKPPGGPGVMITLLWASTLNDVGQGSSVDHRGLIECWKIFWAISRPLCCCQLRCLATKYLIIEIKRNNFDKGNVCCVFGSRSR